MPPPGAFRKGLVGAMSIALGVSSLLWTHHMARKDFAPVLRACNDAPPTGTDSDGDRQEWLERQGFHRYEPMLGGNVACIMTQFVRRLLYEDSDDNTATAATAAAAAATQEDKQQKAPRYRVLGCMAFLLRLSLFLPVYALISADAAANSRQGGWVQNPTIVLALSQLLGSSAIFALLWLPSYLMSSDREEERGGGSSSHRLADKAVRTRKRVRRAHAAMATMLALATLAAMVLLCRPLHSRAWTIAAGIAGGPALAAFPLALGVLFDLPCDRLVRSATAASTASPTDASDRWVRAYGVAGALSFCGWSIVVFVLFSTYAIHYKTLGSDVVASSGFVHFVMADAAALFVCVLLYLAYHSLWTAVESVLQALIFGPGAAIAMALAQLEHAQGRVKGEPAGAGSSSIPSFPRRQAAGQKAKKKVS